MVMASWWKFLWKRITHPEGHKRALANILRPAGLIASVTASVNDSTIRKRRPKMASMEQLQSKNYFLTQRKVKAHLTFAKNIFMIPKNFFVIFCGLRSQKWNFQEDMGPTTSGVKPTQHSTTRTSYQQSNTEVVMISRCFATSRPRWITIINWTMNSSL